VAAPHPGTTPISEAASLHREDHPYTTSLDVTFAIDHPAPVRNYLVIGTRNDHLLFGNQLINQI
jgi:hypothetical protein